MMMADVFQAMAVLGVIETLVLYLPTTLGHVIERTTADCSHRGIGEPEGFNHLAVRLVLTVEDDPYGLPTQSVPRIEVVGVPELDLIRSVPKGNCGRLGGKSFLRLRDVCPDASWRGFAFHRLCASTNSWSTDQSQARAGMGGPCRPSLGEWREKPRSSGHGA